MGLVYDQQTQEVYAEYYHKDHLGNIRLAFTDRNEDGKVELLGLGCSVSDSVGITALKGVVCRHRACPVPTSQHHYRPDSSGIVIKLGRNTLLLGPTSEITQQNDYYPFGLRQEGDGLVFHEEMGTNKYRYNGKEFSEELGMYDYGARWYDPAVGRWNSVDPLADAASAWTPYRYAFDNPIIYLDPDGMYEWRVNTKTGERTQIGGEGGKGTQHIYFDDSKNISTTIEAEDFYVGAIAKDRYSEGEFQFGVSEHDLWSDIPEEYQGAYDKFDLVERYKAQLSGDAKYSSIREQESAGLSRSEMIWNVQDYGIHLDNKYGNQSSLVMAHDVGLLGAMTPGGGINNLLASYAKVIKASRGLRSMRSFNPKFGPSGRRSSSNKSLVPYSPMKPLGKMSWNQFRSSTKGQFKGPSHMRKAAEAYKKYKAAF